MRGVCLALAVLGLAASVTGAVLPYRFTRADATNAFRVAELLVRDHVPRDAGTPQGAAAARAIAGCLRAEGCVAALEAFTDETPLGRRRFVNVTSEIRAREGAPWVILLSHYDTKRGVPMPGANDGASTAGLLVALAGAVRRTPARRLNVLFVWTDGEECALSTYAPNDGLHGSRHAAAELRASGRRVRAIICLDMLGDRDLSITVPANGDAPLRKLVCAAARSAALPDLVSLGDMRVVDDHVPFAEAGFPAVDLIDFNYGSQPGRNDYWHTADDTIDKISVDSLFASGSLVLSLIALLEPEDLPDIVGGVSPTDGERSPVERQADGGLVRDYKLPNGKITNSRTGKSQTPE